MQLRGVMREGFFHVGKIVAISRYQIALFMRGSLAGSMSIMRTQARQSPCKEFGQTLSSIGVWDSQQRIAMMSRRGGGCKACLRFI